MKYIDVEKLKDKIESISLIPQTSADYNDGREDMKMMFLNIIDSLQQEQPEVNLEKEIELIKGDYEQVDVAWNNDFDFIARHFFELGINARIGE